MNEKKIKAFFYFFSQRKSIGYSSMAWLNITCASKKIFFNLEKRRKDLSLFSKNKYFFENIKNLLCKIIKNKIKTE